jgi:hypothetical protein
MQGFTFYNIDLTEMNKDMFLKFERSFRCLLKIEIVDSSKPFGF